MNIKKLSFAILLSLFFSNAVTSQELEKGKDYFVSVIGFYNLENIFDTIDTEGVLDTEFSPTGDKTWTSKKYYAKLDNMADIISQMGTEVNPEGLAILGFAEVENEATMQDLVKRDKLKDRKLKVIFHDGWDARGVDVGFLYNPKYFEFIEKKAYRLRMPEEPNLKTRDQLLVKGKLHGEEIYLMVAHWPSRRGGEKVSAPKRVAAAKLARHVVDSLLTLDPKAKIFYMGDLNDDPTNESVKDVMKTTWKTDKMEPTQMFNAMEPFFKKGIGTLAWDGAWNLFDQILISQNAAVGDFKSYRFYKAKIFDKDLVKVRGGKDHGHPYRTFLGNTFIGGYSDHFGVYVFMVKEK